MTGWLPVREVSVFLDFGRGNRIPVGSLAADAVDRVFFEYDAMFEATGLDPTPLTWSTSAGLIDVGRNVGDRTLEGMFRDAAPDGWAKKLLLQRLAAQGYDPSDARPLDLLSLVGPHRIGALDFEPAVGTFDESLRMTLDDLAATVLRSGGDGDAGAIVAQRLAGSLGGARPKASIWFDGDQPSAAPVRDAHPWIVKFPNPVTDDVDAGAVEYAYSLMAGASGIVMPPTRLLPGGNGPGFFAVSRFDRLDGRRFHFQSLSGLVDRDPLEGGSYEELLLDHMTITSSDEPDEQLLRRMVFNVLAYVRDDHVRNHGFLMQENGQWIASPAYDVTFDDLTAHQLSIGANSGDPGRDDLRHVVASAGGDPALVDELVTEIAAVVAEWPSFAREADVPTRTIDRIATMLVPAGRRRRILQQRPAALFRQASSIGSHPTTAAKGPDEEPSMTFRRPAERTGR